MKKQFETFKNIFKKTKLEQQQFAVLIGVTPSGISKILKGDSSTISEPIKLLSCLSVKELQALKKKREKMYK